jgi:hypothetical protein
MRALPMALLVVLAVGCGGESAREKGGAYDTARDLCSLDSAAKLADEFGGDANDPSSVARAYAETEYSRDERADARAGCLDGIRDRR